MGSQRFSKDPAHLRVRDLLARKIATGEWNAGKELPSESVLARQFGVSCGTVRCALELLERECAVVRRRGGGRFVAVGDPDRRTIRIAYPRAEGSHALPEVESTLVVEDWADETECVRLHLRSTDRVYRIWRTHFAAGLPFMAERTSLAAALFPCLADRAFPAHGIVDLARAFGVALGVAHEHASIGAASEAAADALGCEEGAPVLVLDRVVATRDGQPAEWRLAECSLTGQQLSALSARDGGGA
jgi:DNA-binding GntR family transcriptional regulator